MDTGVVQVLLTKGYISEDTLYIPNTILRGELKHLYIYATIGMCDYLQWYLLYEASRLSENLVPKYSMSNSFVKVIEYLFFTGVEDTELKTLIYWLSRSEFTDSFLCRI
jgi:hypothetical protein